MHSRNLVNDYYFGFICPFPVVNKNNDRGFNYPVDGLLTGLYLRYHNPAETSCPACLMLVFLDQYQ
ncbi:MAG TPA: hypothetical protein DCR43_01480 [Bacteroidales bacterium]|nr:MAG: hypothetical protein A2X11_10775 [Bacteroidetes bacterium GWE2_42_24]OFY28159.1 MAG: hypothetical protein A2X09_01030 [Bacteroidetes bacterium GWF2_43_11]PKP24828.1 MAG: hypothetical protein CVU06_04615 [Bacteroidetes bacterium HGW-Bacteroidetes-22]HAQ64521.1 hypothetical protein [Bacteroidales bacterium]